MKEFKAIKAYQVLKRIGHAQFPIREAYQIFKLTKELEPIFEIHLEYERELIERLGGHVDPSGMLTFDREDGLEEYQKGIAPIGEEDCSDRYTPVSIRLDSLNGMMITPDDMYALDGFINFE